MASASPKLVLILLFVIFASNLAMLDASQDGLENKDVCKVDKDCARYSVICGGPSRCYNGKCECIYTDKEAKLLKKCNVTSDCPRGCACSLHACIC
ncbi:hypothetical protein vseg_001709 [Gypsophila vaccaria]